METFSAGCGFTTAMSGKKSVVRNTQNADLFVALRNVFDEPVDRVVGVGRFVYRRRILWAVERAVHHIVALGAVFAANVLHDADVPTVDHDVGRVVVHAE